MTKKQLKELLICTRNRSIVKFLLQKNDLELTSNVININKNSNNNTINEKNNQVIDYIRNIEAKKYVYKK